MANEQTSVPLYAASEILTAANLNISAGTGVPVFATTVTRDAAFGGAGEKVLAEGQLCYLSDSNIVQYYSGASWATVGPSTAGGLVFISATTIGSAVASVTVSGAFSSTYDNYKIIMTGGASSGSDINIYLQLGSTTTGYYSVRSGWRYANTALNFVDSNNGSNWLIGSGVSTTPTAMVDVLQPNLAKNTFFSGVANTSAGIATTAGYQSATTQFTAFTLTPDSGTLTGGTVYVYGYAKA